MVRLLVVAAACLVGVLASGGDDLRTLEKVESGSAVNGGGTTSSPYAAAATLHSGRGLAMAHCPGEMLRVREWRLCLPPLQAHLAAGTCLAYIFGVNSNSPLADVLASRGCE